MTAAFIERLRGELAALKASGLYKTERVITSPQSASISVSGGQVVLNTGAGPIGIMASGQSGKVLLEWR